jgi:hypothetical protein
MCCLSGCNSYTNFRSEPSAPRCVVVMVHGITTVGVGSVSHRGHHVEGIRIRESCQVVRRAAKETISIIWKMT